LNTCNHAGKWRNYVMLNENEVKELVRKLRAADHELALQIDPSRDPVDDEKFMERMYHQQRLYVVGDHSSRDQIDIIARYFDLDPEMLRMLKIIDYMVLVEKWMLSVPLSEYEEFESLGFPNFDQMVQNEERKLQSERHGKHVKELIEEHGCGKAIRILNQESLERRMSNQVKASETKGTFKLFKSR